VIWTDVVQTTVLALGGLACFAIVTAKVSGGLPEILSTAWSHGKLSFADLGPDGVLHPTTLGLTLTERSVSMLLLVGLSHWLAEYACNQNMVQKYCASASMADARRALWIGCAWMLPLWMGVPTPACGSNFLRINFLVVQLHNGFYLNRSIEW
jgi:SSS family solute:Na+ symporter